MRLRVGAAGGLALASVALVTLPAAAQESAAARLVAPGVILRGVAFEAALEGAVEGTPELHAGGLVVRGERADDGWRFHDVRVTTTGRVRLDVFAGGAAVAHANVRALPGWVSVVPPLLAIAIALLTKQVVPALFAGLWVGAASLAGFTPRGVFAGMLDSFQVYVLGAVTSAAHAQIILFSFMIGGMVGILIKNGGMQGVVNIIVRWATSPRRGQVTTAILGLVIFFDDYANTLVVGNTMRQVTDRLRISREKLAYIVDSTAAPVSCVALVTTWIGYEVGLIGTAVERIPGLDMSAYSIFLNSIPYSFYPLLTIFFVLTVANLGRDFGPMYDAEARARTTGQVLAADADVDAAARGQADELTLKEGRPVRALNAILPIVVLIGAVLTGLYVTGSGDELRDIIGSADSYAALMWGSLLGVVVAAALTLAQRILTMSEVVDAWYAGLKSMLFAMIILVLAWSLSGVSEQLHTAEYLVSVLGDSLHPGVVPALVFVLASATAFATGSSWATMGILLPLVLPLVWAVLQAAEHGYAIHVLYSTVACVLAGAVLGDHCSPISDTTILSSMASGCDHVDHVRTQLPYALTVGTVATLFGSLPTGFDVPWWLCLPVAAAVLYAIVRWVGRPLPEPADGGGSA